MIPFNNVCFHSIYIYFIHIYYIYIYIYIFIQYTYLPAYVKFHLEPFLKGDIMHFSPCFMYENCTMKCFNLYTSFGNFRIFVFLQISGCYGSNIKGELIIPVSFNISWIEFKFCMCSIFWSSVMTPKNTESIH